MDKKLNFTREQVTKIPLVLVCNKNKKAMKIKKAGISKKNIIFAIVMENKKYGSVGSTKTRNILVANEDEGKVD